MSPTKKPIQTTEKAIEIEPLTTKTLDQLSAFLSKSGLEEIEISQGDSHIRLKRPGNAATVAYAAPQPTTQLLEPKKETPKSTFNSPMIGTFYQSPSPEAAAFIKVGDVVKNGQILCIIEAMKTMNHIESDRAGTVTAILVNNATPVEFGQPLFVIE